VLDPRVPNRIMLIAQDLLSEEETKLLSFLDKNSVVFAWATSNLTGVSKSIIEHKLDVNPSTKPKKKKLHKMSEEKNAAAKVEVQRLLDASFTREVEYPS
jgi:hypothetical protein